MIKDKEGNVVNLLEKPNGHLLILGCSGSGKTYFSCRKIEEEINSGKKFYIFDYSDSYSWDELEKNRFQFINKVNVLNPMKGDVVWNFTGRDIKRSLANVVLRALEIRSYYQKMLIIKVLDRLLCTDNCFSFPQFMKQLEDMYCLEEETETAKNIMHLLNRMEPYGEINGLIVSQNKQINLKPNLTIIQLSDYPEIQRKFLTNFLVELFWEEVRYGEKKADIVIFDEFQNMEIRRRNALSSMLREGRKFGLSVYLSTQFLEDYKKETVSTLMQAGNLLFFKPTKRDMMFVANMIDPNHAKKWATVLNQMQIGEVVIKGNYCLNAMKKEIQTPILCKVEEVKTHEI